MTVFVDTSAWTAVKDRRDGHHLAAVQYMEGVVARRERLATTDFILDETYVGLGRD